MKFDPDNEVVQLCAQGMDKEGQGSPEEAAKLYYLAWDKATDSFEKFTAAHYVARQQKNVTDKLTWDKIALEYAIKADNNSVKDTFPSLYLNIAKCYEDLNDYDHAREHYQLASSYIHLLPDDGYGRMIRSGISAGLERVIHKKNQA